MKKIVILAISAIFVANMSAQELRNEKFEGKKLYFCSDIHYNHENAISFGNRPFSFLI